MELSELARRCACELGPKIHDVAEIIAVRPPVRGKVLACGNGGSAADAQHFVAEMVGRLERDGPALAAMSLSSDPSVTTAVANDYGFEQLFARQVEALGRPGDVLLVISTSGRSPNIVNAVAVARRLGCEPPPCSARAVIPLSKTATRRFDVPATNPQRVQEIHTALLHQICLEIEEMRGNS